MNKVVYIPIRWSIGLEWRDIVVSVNEFSATCNWQVVGVQVEQNRCKDRALRKAVTLGFPRTGGIAHVHPESWNVDLEAADPSVGESI